MRYPRGYDQERERRRERDIAIVLMAFIALSAVAEALARWFR